MHKQVFMSSTSVPFGTDTIVAADGVAQPDAQVTADDCWLTNSRHEKLFVIKV